jgi:hypothetical protein
MNKLCLTTDKLHDNTMCKALTLVFSTRNDEAFYNDIFIIRSQNFSRSL